MVEVLEPFEEGNGDTTGVDVQIWDDQNVAVEEDFVGSWGCWTVGSLGNDLQIRKKKKSLFNVPMKKCISSLTLALILPAFSLVMTFSTAAGTRMSHGSYMRFSPLYSLAPGNPTIVPLSLR